MKSMESVEIIGLIGFIKSNLQKSTKIYLCTFLGIILVVYILGEQEKNELFIFCSVLREQKGKIKSCVLTLYLYTKKMTRLKPPRQILTLSRVA